MQLLAKAHSWLTIQLYFKGRKETRSIYNCIIWNQNLRNYSSEEPLSKESIFKEPKSHFGVSPFSWTYLNRLNPPCLVRIFVLSHVRSSSLSTTSSISPSKFFLTDILVKKLNIKFTLKYRNFWKHQVKTSGLTNVCSILTNILDFKWGFFHCFLIHRPAYFLFQYYKF